MGRVARSLKHGWNAFKNPPEPGFAAGPTYASNPMARRPLRIYNDKSVVGSIYTRLSVDFSQVEFFHAKLDDQGVAIDVVQDSLNDCLVLDPNIDQNAQALKQDLALTLFEEGYAAVVPTDADLDPSQSTSYDIKDMRVGSIVGWSPRRVTMMVYDDREVDDDGKPVNGGVQKQITMDKRNVAIIYNPFFNVMNSPNGTLQRINRKLQLLDGIDEAIGSGKLDIIFQLPYTVRGANRQKQAEERRSDLANQLKDDELGIGYIDVSEKVIQLNRPIDNKLLEEIQALFAQLYAELGLTPEIMNGTASRDTINNYFERTIEPIANSVALEYKRKFLTKTARTQKHSIEIYRDPLKLIPTSDLADIVDKLTRAGVATANDIRPKIGLMPSKQPQANVLGNPNMPADKQLAPPDTAPPEEVTDAGLPVDAPGG